MIKNNYWGLTKDLKGQNVFHKHLKYFFNQHIILAPCQIILRAFFRPQVKFENNKILE